MIITEIPHFSSKIIRFQVTLKSAVEFTCALEFKISSQQKQKNSTKRHENSKIWRRCPVY